MELEISGKPVDLPATTRGLVRLNKSVAALLDLNTRRGEYSWPLSLPATRQNAGIFGQILHPQTLGKFVKATFPFVLRAGGVVWRGTFSLTGLRGGYTGTLSTESLDWATGLGEKKLNELTTLQPVAYDGSQLEALLQGNCDMQDLQFPLVAYGNFFSPPTTDEDGNDVPSSALQVIDTPLAVDDWVPSVYYLNVLRAILREAGGYYPMGPVLTDEQVRRWVIPGAGSSGDFWPWGLLLPVSRAASLPEQHFSYYESGPGDGFTNTAAGFDEANQVAYFMPRTPDTVRPGGTRAMSSGKAEFFAPATGAYSFAWDATIGAASQFIDEENNSGSPGYFAGFAPVVIGLVVFRQGEGYEGADGGICTNGRGRFDSAQQRVINPVRLDRPGNYALSTGLFSGNTSNLYLEAGDVVRLLVFTCRYYSRTGDGINRYKRDEFHLVTNSINFACTAFDGPTLLNPAAVLPAINQKEFLRDFMIKTNTVPVVDINRRAVHFLDRQQHMLAQGAPLNIDSVADPASISYGPVFSGTTHIVFSPAPTTDAAASEGVDVVRIDLSKSRATENSKSITSPFAATGIVRFSVEGRELNLPCVATKEELATARSEASQSVSDKAPRVLLYEAPRPGASEIPFQERMVSPGTGRYLDTSLAWAGKGGAVNLHYKDFLAQALRGHICQIQCSLTPSLYEQLSPGRRVDLLGAQYTLESISGYDPSELGGTCLLELLRYV